MAILATERLLLRELDATRDAAFVNELLNTPKFLKFIGDRGVRSVADAASFIETRYRQSYRDNGYGLWCVENNVTQVGLCGFVKRDMFENADIGFAFLPEHEGKGFGFESARAALEYGRITLGFQRVLAITSQDNDASGKLLAKLGFSSNGLFRMPDGESVKLYEKDA